MLPELDHFYVAYLSITDAYERANVTASHRSAYQATNLTVLRAIRDASITEAHKTVLLNGIHVCHEHVRQKALHYDDVHFGQVPDFRQESHKLNMRKHTYDQARRVLDKFYAGETIEVTLAKPIPDESTFQVRAGTITKNARMWVGCWEPDVGRALASFSPKVVSSAVTNNVYFNQA